MPPPDCSPGSADHPIHSPEPTDLGRRLDTGATHRGSVVSPLNRVAAFGGDAPHRTPGTARPVSAVRGDQRLVMLRWRCPPASCELNTGVDNDALHPCTTPSSRASRRRRSHVVPSPWIRTRKLGTPPRPRRSRRSSGATSNCASGTSARTSKRPATKAVHVDPAIARAHVSGCESLAQRRERFAAR